MEVLLFVISWFVVGFISMIIVWIADMRGQEYDENFFNKECVGISFLMFFLGYISLILAYCAFTSEKKYFTRFMYKVANIGVKSEKKEEEK